MRIEVGDKVRIKDETELLTVRYIIDHDNFKAGPNVYTVQRLYFKEDHQPEYDWRVTEVNGEKYE